MPISLRSLLMGSLSFIGVMFVLWGGLVIGVQSAHATSTIPIIMPPTLHNVDGESVQAIVNNEPVTVGWYVDGPLTDCVLIQNNETLGQSVIVEINTASMPSFGSTVVVPPPDSTTVFTVHCDEFIEETPLNMTPPTATLSSDQGLDLTNSNLTGRVDYLVIRWSSTDATRCSYITRDSAVAGTITETSSSDYSNRLGTSGWILYDGNPRYINETTTFTITCENENSGATYTDTLMVTVGNPPPPSLPIVNLWSPDTPTGTATRSELLGYAWVDMSYNSGNVTWCDQRAYYDDGTQYTAGQPSPWDSRTNLSYNYTNIRLATSTTFWIRCGRPEVTIGGVIYPATSTTRTFRIAVQMPGTVTDDVNSWDRTYLPPVMGSITASPNPATTNVYSGYAYPRATLARYNADFCDLRAGIYNPGTGAYDRWVSIPNWDGRVSGNSTTTHDIRVSTTTRLVADCWREYDRDYGTVAERDNGNAYISYMLETDAPDTPIDPPRTYMYGNSVVMSADAMWNSATNRIGFNNRAGSPRYLENSVAAATSNLIEFPFNHPYGEGDTYDIMIRLCDENDGESTFTISTEDDGVVGSLSTDLLDRPSDSCGSAYNTVSYRKIAEGAHLDHGDIVTLECDTPDDGEYCRVHELWFGAPGTVETPQVNPVVTSQNQQLMWFSEHAVSCWNFRYTRVNGATGYWRSSGPIRGIETETIATSTTFRATCGRPSPGDGSYDSENVQVYVPFSATLSAQATIGAGTCVSRGDYPTVGLNADTFGQTVTNPPSGFGADSDGWCVPLVDLAAVVPATSIASAIEDNVRGTYNHVDVLMAIRNVMYDGAGADLPRGSGVSYRAVMQPMPAHGLADIASSPGTFNATITAPTLPLGYTESGILTRYLDNVPFGTHTVYARVNLDGSPNYSEVNPDPTNNMARGTADLPVPYPPMHINADNLFIRKEQTVVIDWGVDVLYRLICYARGPGGLNVGPIDTLDAGRHYTDSYTTTPLNSTGEFELQCTEPLTNTTFTEKVRVEVVPDFEEI